MADDNRIAIVTGATGALGRVVARGLLDRGIKIVSTYRTPSAEQELEAFLGGPSHDLTSIEADVTNEDSVKHLFEKVVSKFGRVDILLNIVGAYVGGEDIAHTKVDDWDYMMKVNLKSAFLCSKYALPIMIKQDYGKIVNISARPAVERRARAKSGAYAVSKAAVAVLTETIAEEVKKFNITVNAVMPSVIDTPDNRAGMPNADTSRWVKPEEICSVIMFLVSDDANITSGALVPVYGKD
jgi:NAD(P)-dependent dehydrogenase (short-subunit alcohol dehydrogenase family)